MLICVCSDLSFFINDTFHGFYMLVDGFHFQLICLGFLFCELFNTRWFLLYLTYLLSLVNLRLSITPNQLWLLFLLWIYLFHQFTEKLCVFVQHRPLRIFISSINLWAAGIIIKRLSLHRMIIVGIGSGVFLIVLGLIICMSLCPEKALAHLVDRIGHFRCYKLYRTVGSIVVVIIGGSQRRNVAASGSPASHWGKPRWKGGIFPLETVRRVISLDL